MADFCSNASPKITSDPRTSSFEFYDVSIDRTGFAVHSQRQALGGVIPARRAEDARRYFLLSLSESPGII